MRGAVCRPVNGAFGYSHLSHPLRGGLNNYALPGSCYRSHLKIDPELFPPFPPLTEWAQSLRPAGSCYGSRLKIDPEESQRVRDVFQREDCPDVSPKGEIIEPTA